jgi:malate dehydrogenase (oxaloacetate-decarboxylating)(NADP+)
VPASILKAYGLTHLEFGPDYIVPKPLDNRVCLWEAPAVAKAAMESGVSRIRIDLENYERQLKNRLKIE